MKNKNPKFMKPSEFLRKINVDVIGDLSELDKRFFDREEEVTDKELKELIKQLKVIGGEERNERKIFL